MLVQRISWYAFRDQSQKELKATLRLVILSFPRPYFFLIHFTISFTKEEITFSNDSLYLQDYFSQISRSNSLEEILYPTRYYALMLVTELFQIADFLAFSKSVQLVSVFPLVVDVTRKISGFVFHSPQSTTETKHFCLK